MFDVWDAAYSLSIQLTNVEVRGKTCCKVALSLFLAGSEAFFCSYFDHPMKIIQRCGMSEAKVSLFLVVPLDAIIG